MFPVPEEFLSVFFNHFLAFPVVVYHFVSSGSSLFSIAYFTASTFKVFLCRLTYSLPTSFLHPDKRWCTVSLCSPQNLHLSHSTNPPIFFHALVSTICSCNANILDVFLGSVLHFNQPESCSVYCLSISLRNSFSAKLCYLFLFCPSVKDFFQFFFPCFFPFSLTFFASNYTSFIK